MCTVVYVGIVLSSMFLYRKFNGMTYFNMLYSQSLEFVADHKLCEMEDETLS
jgi:hypothetical protein